MRQGGQTRLWLILTIKFCFPFEYF